MPGRPPPWRQPMVKARRSSSSASGRQLGSTPWRGSSRSPGASRLQQSPLVQPNQQSIASVRNTPLDWYSGAGRVAGDIAQVMVPRSLVKAAVPALARFPAAVDTAMAAGQAGAGYVEGDESRAANALRATAMAGGAHRCGPGGWGVVRRPRKARRCSLAVSP